MAIVTQADLKYEVVVSPNNHLIKAYRGFWGDNARLDFCHLFWGVIGMTLIIPILATLLTAAAPILVPLYLIKNRKPKKVIPVPAKTLDELYEEIVNKPPPKPHPWRDKLLRLIVRGGGRICYALVYVPVEVACWVSQRRAFWRKVDVGVRALLVVCACAVILGLVGLSVDGFYKLALVLLNFSPHTWLLIGEGVGTIVLSGSLFVLALFLGTLGVRRGYHAQIGHYAARPAVGSWELFVMAYRAVKTNTCPRIVIKEE